VIAFFALQPTTLCTWRNLVSRLLLAAEYLQRMTLPKVGDRI